MLASFLIGLREGLEAALVVGILVAYLRRVGRADVLPRLWIGVGLAIALAVSIGAVLTFGSYALTSDAQELVGGLLSVLTVVMVTWMIFWMQRTARTLKATLEGGIDHALAAGGLWALVAIGFVSVAREGMETTLLLWSMLQSFGDTPSALLGATLGLGTSVLLGWLLARGVVRLDLRRFFAWTGGLLVFVAAGVLAYGINDLQEGGLLPGPASGAAPIDPATGAAAMGWGGFPLGWAFDLSGAIPPKSPLATVLQATVGFTPQMSWLQVIAWALYVAIVGALFVRGLRRRAPRTAAGAAPAGAMASSAAASPATGSPAAASLAAPSHDTSAPEPQGA